MARCDYPGCDWRGKKAGKAIHKAKAHGRPHGVADRTDEALDALVSELQERWGADREPVG